MKSTGLFHLIEKHRYLAISLLFSLALIIWRIFYTGSISYLFLVWNLFLAFIPFALSELAIDGSRKVGSLQNSVVLLICIAFLPNSPYIITDLFHLRWHYQSYIWYDTVLITSCAWNGLLLFFHTLVNVDEKIFSRFGKLQAWVFKLSIIALCAFGVYLGRYLRFNSWDIISNPLGLFQEIADRVVHPHRHPLTWSMTIIYAFFLFFTYLNFIGFRRRDKLPYNESRTF